MELLEASKSLKSKFETAKKIASKSSFRFKHGAILISGGRIISTGYNLSTFNSFGRRFVQNPAKASLHAEISCILGVSRKNTQGATVLVVRTKNDSFRLSKPCDMCMSVLSFVGIKKVIYSISDEEYGVCLL